MIVFAFGGIDSIVADDIGNVNQPVVSDNLFNIDQEKSAKGIDKSIPLPYNIRREATDTVASYQIKEIIALNLTGCGRLFLFIILVDNDNKCQQVNDHCAKQEKDFPSHVQLYHLPSV